jgi:alkylhydroperoxidase family enzyme
MNTRYASGRRTGIDEEMVRLLADYEHGPFSAREKSALRLTDEIYLDSWRVGEDVVGRARGHFTDPELMELIWAICLWIETGRMFHTLEVPYGEGPHVESSHA